MANNRTLTAANAKIIIAVQAIVPVPHELQGFSADDVSAMDAQTIAETSMGVDGRFSAGYVPAQARQTITLQADSESNDFFETWAQLQRVNKEIYPATGLQHLKAVNRKYALIRGFLVSTSPIASARKILPPRQYIIEWERVEPAPVI